MPITQSPARIPLLGSTSGGVVTGVTTGTSIPLYVQAQSQIVFYLRSVGTTSGGTIILEEADWADDEGIYSGTWNQLASVLASSFTGGAQVAFHFGPSAFGYVRARISSTITGGGTITVALRDW